MAVILQSSATLFIGDNIEKFEEGGSRAHRKERAPYVAERRDIFSRWLRIAVGSGRYPLKKRVFGKLFFRSAGDETHIAPFGSGRAGKQVYHDLANKISKLLRLRLDHPYSQDYRGSICFVQARGVPPVVQP